MKQFIIQDWVGNLCFDGLEFDSFQDGWDFLYETFPNDEENWDEYWVLDKGDLK